MATTKIRCTEKTESPKGTAESSQEGAEKRGRRIFGGRGKDGFEWVAGHPVTRRDPSDRKSAEQLGGRRMAESTPSSEEGAKHPEGYRLIGKAPSPHMQPGGHSIT